MLGWKCCLMMVTSVSRQYLSKKIVSVSSSSTPHFGLSAGMSSAETRAWNSSLGIFFDKHAHTRTAKQQEICYRSWTTYLAAGCAAAGFHFAGGHLQLQLAAPLLSPRSWRHRLLPNLRFQAGWPHGEDQGWCSCQRGRLHPPALESQESLCVWGHGAHEVLDWAHFTGFFENFQCLPVDSHDR